MLHRGCCHCGAVQFEVEAPERVECEDCNGSICGIKSFYIPRSNPDGYSINVRCLDPRPREIVINPFDGQRWERHAHELAHKSR